MRAGAELDRAGVAAEHADADLLVAVGAREAHLAGAARGALRVEDRVRARLVAVGPPAVRAAHGHGFLAGLGQAELHDGVAVRASEEFAGQVLHLRQLRLVLAAGDEQEDAPDEEHRIERIHDGLDEAKLGRADGDLVRVPGLLAQEKDVRDACQEDKDGDDDEPPVGLPPAAHVCAQVLVLGVLAFLFGVLHRFVAQSPHLTAIPRSESTTTAKRPPAEAPAYPVSPLMESRYLSRPAFSWSLGSPVPSPPSPPFSSPRSSSTTVSGSATRGSVPSATSVPSSMPSPSVSALVALVPSVVSLPSERPSASVSATSGSVPAACSAVLLRPSPSGSPVPFSAVRLPKLSVSHVSFRPSKSVSVRFVALPDPGSGLRTGRTRLHHRPLWLTWMYAVPAP